MAFKANVLLIDDMNRNTTKRIECEATVLATAIADMTALLSDLAALTTLGVVKVNYSDTDLTGAFATTAGSNVDTGATFRLQTTDGGVVAYKIPGFDQAKADGNGNIDPLDADVVAFFANFLAAGAFTLADGETITAVLSGKMDQ